MSIVIDRKYYKYVYSAWTQPVLTANGTWGGSSFATKTKNNNSGAYKAFDSSSTTYIGLNTGADNELYFYNPQPLKISKIDFTYYPSTWIINGELYGSNDDSNYVKLATIAHSANTGSITVNNTTGYKYFKIKAISANGSDGSSKKITDFYHLAITATAQTGSTESTSSNYDYYKDVKIKDRKAHGVYYGSTPINAIYYGSQKVYQYHPYDIGYVILYGANTGTKTYTLPKGVYQCCVVGGGWRNQGSWSKAGGAAAEIKFKLTTNTTVVVSSGGLGVDGYLDINGARIVTARTPTAEQGGTNTYTIDTSSSYYVSTVYASDGKDANLSTGASVSPYEKWGSGTQAGGARLAYVGA